MTVQVSAPAAPRHILVTGIGNEFRHDDAAGFLVARQVAARGLPHLAMTVAQGVDVAWLDAWPAFDAVFIVDAVAAGRSPGAIRRWDAVAAPLPAARFPPSTHGMGLGELIELARALGRLPRRLIVYGIEGAAFDPGYGLSPPVAAVVARVVQRILQETGPVA